MFLLGIAGIFVVLVSGVAVKYFFQWRRSVYEIDNKEFLYAALALCFAAVPLVTFVGYKVAINNQVTFHENWNGWETRAEKYVTICTRDGSCRHCYDCDPYYVDQSYDCSYTDSKGKRVSKTCTRKVKKYHSCPYTTEEWTFVVKTTLDDYTIADHNLPTNPENWRWRPFHSVPDYIPSGVPQRWQEVKNRLDAGKPDPVVQRHDYDNYILASHTTIMKTYSESVAKYKAANLFPAFNSQVYNLYYMNRVYFVGIQPAGNWQDAMMHFNGALGMSLQGDLHLVVVDANKVTDPDNYHQALIAYWLSADFGKDALSKNGIVVVLGSKDGKTVEWARASTGMPLGNENLMVQIASDMKGVSLTPEDVLGYPTATVTGERSVNLTLTQSALEKLIWGPNKFQRVHMKSQGKGSAGFEYLLKELEPTGSQKIWILVSAFLVGCIAWGICLIAGVPRYRSR